MSEAKPTRRLSSFLQSKRTERVVELIVVPILLIISLLLPPASVGTRLLNLDLPSIKPNEPSEILGPSGARLNVPEGAVAGIEDAQGKVTLVDLYPGEVILSQRLVDPNTITGDGRYALILAEEQVLMAFPAKDLMSQSRVLKPGDQVDLLFSLDMPTNRTGAVTGAPAPGSQGVDQEEEEQFTFNLLQNVTIAAVVAEPGGDATGGAPFSLLLTISPQDALVLKYVQDAGGIVDIVLRAPGVDRPFEVEPVDVDYVLNRYQIPIEAGR